MSEQSYGQLAGVEKDSSARPLTFEKNIHTVAKGGGVTFAGKMFLNVIRFVAAILLARFLGAEQLGLYSLGLSALNLSVGLSLFGLDAAVIRYVAVQVSRRDEEGLWGTLQIGLGYSMLFSTLTGILLYILAFPIANGVFHDPRLIPILQLGSVFVPMVAGNEMLANALRGFKRMDYVALAQFVFQPITRLVLICILALFGLNALQAIIIFCLSSIGASLLMIFYLQKLFPLGRPFHLARRDLREIASYSLPVWLSGLMVNFQSNIQTLFLGTLGSVAGVGIFSVASQVTIVSGEFSSSINTSAKPLIAELHDKRDISQMNYVYQTANKWIIMFQSPIFLALVLFASPILSIFGEDYRSGMAALIILALADLSNTATGMGGIILDMTGYTKLKLVNSLVRLSLYVVLDILLIPRWGLLGASIAVLAGEGVVNLLRLVEVYVLFKILPYNRSFLKPLAATFAALVVVLSAQTLFSLEMNLLNSAILGFILFAVYAAVIFLLGFSPDELAMLKNIRNRAGKVISK